MPKALKFAMASPVWKLLQNTNTFIYRLSGGKLAASMRGAPLLLLTTRGKKTGEPRTVPLIYFEDGAQLVVVASKGGWPEHPLWYKNLQADPNVEVQRGGQTRRLSARTANAEEHARLWPRAVELYRDYAEYQSWTERKIPLVILSERSS
jgi:deazaflavin-dependent oxidoreductase (nitroreductase family)